MIGVYGYWKLVLVIYQLIKWLFRALPRSNHIQALALYRVVTIETQMAYNLLIGLRISQ